MLAGEFAYTLNVVDIHTTWTESLAVLGKAQVRVQQGLDEIRKELPFELMGIDSDNGSEFINFHLVGYCKEAGIQFTRGRPDKKDDNAHVEQKNWTHVRKLMGWVRQDTAAAVLAMNRLYRGDLRLLQNLFLPSVKLVRKGTGRVAHCGVDTTRPRLPLTRVLECEAVRPTAVAKLRAVRDRVDPFVLSRSVEAQLGIGFTHWRTTPAAPRFYGRHLRLTRRRPLRTLKAPRRKENKQRSTPRSSLVEMRGSCGQPGASFSRCRRL